MDAILRRLGELDWRNLDALRGATEGVLDTVFSNRAILRGLLDSFLGDLELIGLCEHYDFFDKLVLYRDPLGRFRLRLHVFLPEASHKSRPHNHRWSYSSVILAGAYEHCLYGTEDQITPSTSAQALCPVLVQRESRGSVYTLSHTVFHSVAAEPYTVSLMIRGPSVKERFLVLDRKTGSTWWEYGRESETIEERRRKAMPSQRVTFLLDKIKALGVI